MNCVFNKCNNFNHRCTIYDCVHYIKQSFNKLCSFLHDYLCLILLFVSLSIIFIIKFTNFHIGYSDKADVINSIFVNISFSIIASVIFYFVLEYLPYSYKKKKIRRIIDCEISKFREHSRLCKSSIDNAFSYDNSNAATMDEYISKFKETDLSTCYFMPPKTKLMILEQNRENMRLIINNLFLYKEYLELKEIGIFTSIATKSYFISPIIPINFDLPDEERDCAANNQEEIGRSIFEINELLKELK